MAGLTRKQTKTPAHLRQLVGRVLEAAGDPVYAQRKKMWSDHNRLQKVPKTPVCVFLHEGYPLVWQELIPPETLISTDPFERAIELQLRQKLYRHDHIPDDEVLLPTVWIQAIGPKMVDGGGALVGGSGPGPKTVRVRERGEHEVEGAERLWGLPFLRRHTDPLSGAYKVRPVIESSEDLARLLAPRFQIDETATEALRERATELVEGRLSVRVATDDLGASPSETMVSLVGIEAVLYGVVDRPEFIHQMMEFITEAYIAYHREREAAGAVDAQELWSRRVHYDELPAGIDSRRLKYGWAFVAAQSLCGLSPDMYAEFLQPYHARLAEMLGHNRVYYHGCEDLTEKYGIIRQLPNLRRFHISPWSDLEAAAKQLQRDFVLETHVHPGDTLLVHSEAQMREALERIMSTAGDCVLDINLSDIQTVDGNPAVLTTWARIAQEVTERYA